MTYSIIPAFIISVGIFWCIGNTYSFKSDHALQDISNIQQLIHTHFHVGPVSLLPMVVMLILSILKKPTVLSMLSSIMVALCIAIFVQKININDLFYSLLYKPSLQLTGSPILDSALSHGGIQSMLNSMTLAILILTMGRLLETYQFITTLFIPIIRRISSPVSLVFATMSTSVLCNLLMGEAYLSIILSSRIYKKLYKTMGLDSCVLSKSIEEGATFSTPLIPWTTSGTFISTTLGICPFDYLFWSVFNWIAPCVFLLLVSVKFAGLTIYYREQNKKDVLTTSRLR